MAPELVIVDNANHRNRSLVGDQVVQLELSANIMFENTRDPMWKKVGDIAFESCSSSTTLELELMPMYFNMIPLPNWKTLTRY